MAVETTPVGDRCGSFPGLRNGCLPIWVILELIGFRFETFLIGFCQLGLLSDLRKLGFLFLLNMLKWIIYFIKNISLEKIYYEVIFIYSCSYFSASFNLSKIRV